MVVLIRQSNANPFFSSAATKMQKFERRLTFNPNPRSIGYLGETAKKCEENHVILLVIIHERS